MGFVYLLNEEASKSLGAEFVNWKFNLGCILGECKGCFPEHRHTWDSVFSLSWIHEVASKLLLVTILSWPFCPGCTNYLCSLKIRISQAKSYFSSKEKMFGVAFNPSKLLHHRIPQRGRGSTWVYEPYLLEKSRQEIHKGCFPDHRGIGAAVPSWAWLSCWTRKLPNAWGLSVWMGNFSLVVWAGYVMLVRDMENKDFSCSLSVLHKGEHVWCAFWGMENPCNEPCLREQEAAHGNFPPIVGDV